MRTTFGGKMLSEFCRFTEFMTTAINFVSPLQKTCETSEKPKIIFELKTVDSCIQSRFYTDCSLDLRMATHVQVHKKRIIWDALKN